MSRILAYLYSELAYSIVFNMIFGVFFIRKVLKLDKLGDNHEMRIPKRDWFKFSLIMAIIFLLILHLILSYSQSTYWLAAYPNFSLIIILYMVNYSMQSYIVLKLVTKGIGKRYMVNLLFWFFCMCTNIIQAVVIEKLTKTEHYGAMFMQGLMALLNMTMIVTSLAFDKVKEMPEILESLRNESDTGRSIQSSIHREIRKPTANRLYVEFHQQFQVNEVKDSLSCIFKIAVYIDEKHTIITKTDTDFIKLNHEMKKIFPSRSEAHLPEKMRRYSNMMAYGQQKLKCYQNYILELTKTGQFIVPCLLDFLEVPASQRNKIVMNDFAGIAREQIVESQEEDRNRQPFFYVYAQKDKIILENPDFVELIVNRSVHEIVELSHKLKEQKKLTIDILPENPQERDLISFFSVIVNKKSLWRSFASWLPIDINLENKIFNYFDPWFCGFRGINVEIIGHEVVFDGDGKIHTCYLLSLNGNISKNNEQKSERGVILKKRYSQFNSLDKHVRKFMDKKKISQELLPSLPPKFSPFGSKTSPKSRQMRFGIYMKGLIKIQGINHCIKLLQFLQFDTINTIHEVKQTVMQEELVTSPREHSDISYFSELNDKI